MQQPSYKFSMNELRRRNCKLHHGPSFDADGASVFGKGVRTMLYSAFVQIRFLWGADCVSKSSVLLAFIWLVVTKPDFR